jgi:hypothetical protein
MAQAAQQVALRIWIVDNSGSMSSTDGWRMVQDFKVSVPTMVRCSRWEELASSLLYHAKTAEELHAPTEFRLLNQPMSACPQVVTVGDDAHGSTRAADNVEVVRAMVATPPLGRTPLCAQIRAVEARVRAMAPSLRRTNQRCVLVIASDGAATDGDVAAALSTLQDLPVSVVVRLCTDDDSVVDYWNNVDGDLEIEMDVLDDFSAEATEARAVNGWLAYGQPLHMLREWGTLLKSMDHLDEHVLSPQAAVEVLQTVYGAAADDLPDPASQWPAFARALESLVKLENVAVGSGRGGNVALVWDPTRAKYKSWVSVKKLKKAIKPRKPGR